MASPPERSSEVAKTLEAGVEIFLKTLFEPARPLDLTSTVVTFLECSGVQVVEGVSGLPHRLSRPLSRFTVYPGSEVWEGVDEGAEDPGSSLRLLREEPGVGASVRLPVSLVGPLGQGGGLHWLDGEAALRLGECDPVLGGEISASTPTTSVVLQAECLLLPQRQAVLVIHGRGGAGRGRGEAAARAGSRARRDLPPVRRHCDVGRPGVV